ncbi:MAG: hypothetical protein JWN62_2005 [Acidimicrobiales bacterium]|nr:hypothetical protein [Acidimicrobiales bacterium]
MYTSAFTDDDYLRAKRMVLQLAELSSLYEDEAVSVTLGTGLLTSVADVHQLLEDLTDLGYLDRLDEEPARWDRRWENVSPD